MEYLVEIIVGGGSILQEKLNEKAKLGWEVKEIFRQEQAEVSFGYGCFQYSGTYKYNQYEYEIIWIKK